MPDLVQHDRVRASREKPSFSIPSIAAGVFVLLMFFTDGFDFLLGILAIVCGIVGGVLALSPSVRGGIVSILSIVFGILAIITSILQLIF
jgi:hypothetical protein